jgi:hypothetical protein
MFIARFTFAGIETAIPRGAEFNSGSKRLNPESALKVKGASAHRERHCIAQNEADVTWHQIRRDCFMNV